MFKTDTIADTRTVLDRYFSISERGSTLVREMRGGLVTFVTMVYIVVLNPLIIGTVPDKNGQLLGGGHIPNISAIAAVTALVAAVMTLTMGIVGRYPFALATGLGLNAFVAFQVASKMSWPDAMGLVVLEGAVITVLVLTGFRVAVFHAIPAALKSAIAAGIGLFIALIGFVDAGFVRAGAGTPVDIGVNGHLNGWPTFVFVFGAFLIAVLYARKVKGAILIGVVAATVLAVILEAALDIGPQTDATGKVVNPEGWALNVPSFSGKHFGAPDFSVFGNVSLFGGFSAIGIISATDLGVFPCAVGLFRRHGHHDRPGVRSSTCSARTARCRASRRFCSSTAWPRWPAVWPVPRRPPPTSSRRPASVTVRARAWPASSPACCSS